jgi:hypothetical protein
MGVAESIVRIVVAICILPLVFLVGRILDRVFKTKIFRVAVPATLLLAGVIGGPLLLQAIGVVVPATVLSKVETIRVADDGAWGHWYRFEVRYLPLGETAPITAMVGADRTTYDRTRRGTVVDVRHLPIPTLTKFPRLDSRGPFAWLTSPIVAATRVKLVLFLVTGLAVVIALVATGSRGRWRTRGEGARAARWPRFAARLLALAWVGWFVDAATRPFHPEPEPDLAGTATGTIAYVHPITEVWFSRGLNRTPLAQPFDVVEVTYVPASVGDSVVGVDAVDAARLARIARDSQVTFRYEIDDPRRIRIDGATRTYGATNAASLWKGSLPLFALLLGFWLLTRLFRKLMGLS